MGRDLSDISLYQDSLHHGRLTSTARDVRRSLAFLHPGLGFLRSVTHAVCPALWARARRHTVGRPCRPAPPVPSCTSGVLPPPYLLHEEGEGGTPVAFLRRKEGPPAVASTAPTRSVPAVASIARPAGTQYVTCTNRATCTYSTTLFHLLARPTGMTAASPPRPRAPSRGAGSRRASTSRIGLSDVPALWESRCRATSASTVVQKTGVGF